MGSAEDWFCFRNWNVSRLDFYFQFTFQIQLPKLFDLSPCLLTRKRTLGLLSWELGAHVERLAGIHILAKFSHTKGPAREKIKDESCSRRDFKGRAAARGPAQAPPSADIRRGWRARAGSERVPARCAWRRPRTRKPAAHGGQRGCLGSTLSPGPPGPSEEKFSESREKRSPPRPPHIHPRAHLHPGLCWRRRDALPSGWEPGFPPQIRNTRARGGGLVLPLCARRVSPCSCPQPPGLGFFLALGSMGTGARADPTHGWRGEMWLCLAGP